MDGLFKGTFDSGMLSPHGYCLMWRPGLLWSHVVADALIGLAYMSIPVALAYFLRRRTDVAFGLMAWCFVAFILACGMTHFFSIWTLWNPDYGPEALLKIATAGISVATAIPLWPLIPKALAVPSPEKLRQVNAELEGRIQERDRALEALRWETAERLRAEEALVQAQKLEALGQLTGGIAHDFNNLLTIIRGASEILQRRELPPERRQAYLKGVEDAAERAANLTNQLLAFARRRATNASPTDIRSRLEGMRELLQRTLPASIEVRFDLADDVWWTEVDPTQLEMAVLNLVVNARDAMPEGGALTIACRNHSLNGRDFVQISVEDTGRGMDPDVARRAFEPFFTTKEVGKGTGLGLAQVYGFATQSGGVAEIESAPGLGAKVRISLPRAAPIEEGDDAKPFVSRPFIPGGVALLVEDNAPVARFGQALLEELGFEVAENAEDALRRIASRPPRIVVSDIVMPGMNGVEMARRIRAQDANLPVILTTGYSETLTDEETKIWRVLRKPYRVDELAAAVSLALAES